MSESESPSSCQKAIEVAVNVCNSTFLQLSLRCCLCEKFLSIPPIYSSDTGAICGRCKFVSRDDADNWSRQSVYETVAQCFLFPCANVMYGCKTTLKWGEVEEHENTCLFKKLNCPFFHDEFNNHTRCSWIGSGPRLNEHLENSHGDLIKKLPEINFTELRSNQIYLTRILKQLMVVTINYTEPERYSCLVMINGTSADCDAYRFQLELFDETKKNSVILRRSRLEDAVGMEENLTNSDKLLTVQLGMIKELLKNTTVINGRFGIIKKSKKEISYGDRGPGDNRELDESFLRELECPICKNYMVPPIYICTNGHSVCGDCREQMDVCPTCRRPYQNARNYTLEKLTTSVNYPCIYRDAGCSASCTSSKLHEHEDECSFSGSRCFLGCSAGSILNMFTHLHDSHKEAMVVSGDLHIVDVLEDEHQDKVFAICFGGDIFRLSVGSSNFFVNFGIQQFAATKSNYVYDLEIICSTECMEKMTITKECPPLVDQPFEKCVSLNRDTLRRFISEEDLVFFKVHLRKIA